MIDPRKRGVCAVVAIKLCLLAALVCACAPGRRACYAEADAEYLEETDRCIEEGFDSQTCPYIAPAEMKQAREYEACP